MKNITFIILVALLLIPETSFAQTGVSYETLTNFLNTNNDDPGATRLENLINNLYAISITLAALLAVIKIVIGGVKWMMSDVVTTKQDAKKDIRTALIGLLIVVSAVMILTVINPQTATVNLALDNVSTTNTLYKAPPTETVVFNCEAAFDCNDAKARCNGGVDPDSGDTFTPYFAPYTATFEPNEDDKPDETCSLLEWCNDGTASCTKIVKPTAVDDCNFDPTCAAGVAICTPLNGDLKITVTPAPYVDDDNPGEKGEAICYHP